MPAEVVVEDIPADKLRDLEDRTALACMARQRVFFDVDSAFETPEAPVLRPVAVAPTLPEVPTFVSPAEIPRPPSESPPQQ
jgi:hypothetical protein